MNITQKTLFTFLLLLMMISCSKQKPIEELVSLDSVWTHLEEFDKIAKKNNLNRGVGTPGGIASKDYIKKVLEKSGLNPVQQHFTNRSGVEGCNLLVEIKGKSEQEVVMIGSHYDSVEFGPGINDNASGIAVLLEIINVIQRNRLIPEKNLRFAFWDSEETGVEGSPFYYNSLSDSEKEQITTYLNIDMIASKEGEIIISDTDGSTIESLLDEYREQDIDGETLDMLRQMYESIKFAEGSSKLEQLAKDVFGHLGISVKEDLLFARNSDTNPFLEHIPTLGISATKINTETTEDGGEAVLFAPCYHQACDDINNIDKEILNICLIATSNMIQKIAISEE